MIISFLAGITKSLTPTEAPETQIDVTAPTAPVDQEYGEQTADSVFSYDADGNLLAICKPTQPIKKYWYDVISFNIKIRL